jgi:U6 snRNA-associated Sm-like protein LSm8
MTTDGRIFVGTMDSCDNSANLVLSDAYERIIRSDEDPSPSSVEKLGVYLVRGDLVVVCGPVDEELEDDTDWTTVRGEPLGHIKLIR